MTKIHAGQLNLKNILHRLRETFASYIANAEDKNIATDIANCYNFHGQLSNIICFPNNNVTNTKF